MKERERLRKERKDRSTKRLEKRKKEFRKKLYIACGGIAILLLSLLCLIRFKAASPNRILKQNENTTAESVQLTLVKQLSEEEKTKLESYAKEEGGIELHFLNPEIGEEKIKSEILSRKTDLILGGEEQNVNFLSKLSEEEKIPYLATTFVPKDSLREYSFCLSRSAEDQAVDLSFFAYNEAFRSMGILLPEGKADLLSKEITEAFQELGGVVTVYSYTSEDDFRAKLSELETAGIDILFLEYYNEEANTILAEEHNFTVLLGEDWDRAAFPSDTKLQTNCLLYGKNTKNETVSDSEISEMETSSPEQESISSTQVEEESEATSSADSVLSVVEASKPAIVKVIIETCLLTIEEIKKASALSEEAGAHFVKTSTGFSTGGATVEDVKLMKESVSDKMKIKASGGIRSREFAEELLAAGADRLGVGNGLLLL